MCIGPNKVAKDENELLSSNDSAVKTFTSKELRSHNTPASAWAAVHGKVLDITSFAKRHPGGDLILLAAGKDASILFETYHPRGVPPALVKKLTIGEMKKGEIEDSFYSWDSGFYDLLRKRVLERLDERNLTRRGSYEILIKALMLLSGFWYCLIKMAITTDNYKMAILYSTVMGCFAAFIGTCIQHDGNHGAFSNHKWVNKVAGWTLDDWCIRFYLGNSTHVRPSPLH